MRLEHLLPFGMGLEIGFQFPQLGQYRFGRPAILVNDFQALTDPVVLAPLFKVHDFDGQRQALFDPMFRQDLDARDTNAACEHDAAGSRLDDRFMHHGQERLDFLFKELKID